MKIILHYYYAARQTTFTEVIISLMLYYLAMVSNQTICSIDKYSDFKLQQ